MKKFEYLKQINLTTDNLNELGKEGWELVSTVIPFKYNTHTNHYITNDGLVYIFKREINE